MINENLLSRKRKIDYLLNVTHGVESIPYKRGGSLTNGKISKIKMGIKKWEIVNSFGVDGGTFCGIRDKFNVHDWTQL